jgi:cytochrome P450
MRRIVNRGFTPRHITSWRPRIDELVADLLAEAVGEQLDVIGDLAVPLPVRVVAELLGADADRSADFRRWADATTRAMSGSDRGGFDEEALAAVLAMADHLGAEIDERQRAPRDDLLTTLVCAHGDDVLTREEAVGFAALLLFAGTETTTNLRGVGDEEDGGEDGDPRQRRDEATRDDHGEVGMRARLARGRGSRSPGRRPP